MNKRITQQELESYLWGAAVLLRGLIDAGDYKQFIFPLLFFKRISDVWDEEYQATLADSDGDLSYAKVRFDPDSFTAVTGHLCGLPDPLTRAVVWNALRDAVRDAELPPTAYLEAARTHLPRETDLAIVQGVLAFAGTQVADRFLAPDQRAAGLATLGSLCRDLIRRTEDGDNPGLRLTAVRHFIDVAAHPETIAAWLADGTVPGGPELDPELRKQLEVGEGATD